MAVHQALAADLLLINGRLLTMDAHHTVAQAVAVAVKDGKIVLVGANAQVGPSKLMRCVLSQPSLGEDNPKRAIISSSTGADAFGGI